MTSENDDKVLEMVQNKADETALNKPIDLTENKDEVISKDKALEGAKSALPKVFKTVSGVDVLESVSQEEMNELKTDKKNKMTKEEEEMK